MQFGRIEFRHVVYDFHLFAKIFAGDVAAPFSGIILTHPAIDATIKHGHMAVAHTLHRRGGERHPASIVVTENYVRVLMRYGQGHLEFQVPTRE